MRGRLLPYGLVAALLAAVVFVTGQSAASAPAPLRIMPLGDSITAGPGCWRAFLWDQLQRAGYTNIDFVGTQNSGGCAVPLDCCGAGKNWYPASTTMALSGW